MESTYNVGDKVMLSPNVTDGMLRSICLARYELSGVLTVTSFTESFDGMLACIFIEGAELDRVHAYVPSDWLVPAAAAPAGSWRRDAERAA